MVHGLKPYPRYKDSGVPWVGGIPMHWKRQRGKALFAESHLPVHESDEIVTCFRNGQVTLRRNRRSGGFMVALLEAGYQGVRTGQLVIHSMDAFAGAVGVSDSDGKCTPEYIVCTPRSGDSVPAYFAAALRVAAQFKFVQVACPAVRERAPRLRYPNFGDLQLPVPGPDEQCAIVKFLDYLDRRIWRYIRAKRRLTALLDEQEQVIIHGAVTRGLDPDARFKPSGVEWLGGVPEHWEVKKLKQLTRFANGIAFKPSDWRLRGVPIIRIQNLNGGDDFNFTDRTDLPEHLLVLPGNLLFAWSGNRGTSFGPFIWDRDFAGYLNQHIFKLRGYALDERFFFYQLRAVTAHVEEQAHGIIGLVHITKPELGMISVPVPPLREQGAIADYLDEVLSRIREAKRRARRELDLLQECRARLIADVVTGKLDVRAVAARLPERAEEPEILDIADMLTGSDETGDDTHLEVVAEEADA